MPIQPIGTIATQAVSALLVIVRVSRGTGRADRARRSAASLGKMLDATNVSDQAANTAVGQMLDGTRRRARSDDRPAAGGHDAAAHRPGAQQARAGVPGHHADARLAAKRPLIRGSSPTLRPSQDARRSAVERSASSASPARSSSSSASMAASTYWMQRPSYALLFADMDPESAGDVVSRLKAAKVEYQLDAGRPIGPRARVERSTSCGCEFASAGLPSSGRIGFEIFDRTAFGATEFLEQVNYRRALEGEIARTIATLGEVSSARVHIAMSRSSLFASKEQPAKASVVLKLRGNHPPDQRHSAGDRESRRFQRRGAPAGSGRHPRQLRPAARAAGRLGRRADRRRADGAAAAHRARLDDEGRRRCSSRSSARRACGSTCRSVSILRAKKRPKRSGIRRRRPFAAGR